MMIAKRAIVSVIDRVPAGHSLLSVYERLRPKRASVRAHLEAERRALDELKAEIDDLQRRIASLELRTFGFTGMDRPNRKRTKLEDDAIGMQVPVQPGEGAAKRPTYITATFSALLARRDPAPTPAQLRFNISMMPLESGSAMRS
jgi:hypothetical protein